MTEKERSNPQAELDAMSAVANALAPLDEAAVRRVLGWVSERFLGVATTSAVAPEARRHDASVALRAADSEVRSLAELFAAADPVSGPEKALVVGYWLQHVQENEDVDAQALNSELKHLGHQLPNVTSTLSLLMTQRPALVVQTRKTGSTRQARKKYRLTSEGAKRVAEMLARNGAR